MQNHTNTHHANMPRPEQCAVAYYRHAANSDANNPVDAQAKQVRVWAKNNDLVIIREFADRGKSGRTVEGRKGFTALMETVRTSNDFMFILVQDVSRIGRFENADLTAQYISECRHFGKHIIYTNSVVKHGGSQAYPLMFRLERFREAMLAKESHDLLNSPEINARDQP